MKTFYFLTFLLIASIGWGFYLKTTYTPPPLVVSDFKSAVLSTTTNPIVAETPIKVAVSAQKPTPTSTTKPDPNPIQTTSPVQDPDPAPTPAPVPDPVQDTGPKCGAGGACTIAEVEQHNTEADCWVYLNPINKVYNITSYVANMSSSHPGGNVIVPYCGINMYDAFFATSGGHKHSNNALNAVLQTYYIGPLQ